MDMEIPHQLGSAGKSMLNLLSSGTCLMEILHIHLMIIDRKAGEMVVVSTGCAIAVDHAFDLFIRV